MSGWRNIWRNWTPPMPPNPAVPPSLEMNSPPISRRSKSGRTGTRNCWGELDAEQKQVSVTDPEARKMPTAHRTIVGYNAQMAVDAKHKLIAADDVTNEVTDLRRLANVALEAKSNLGLKGADVVADAGYYNAAEVSRCVDKDLTPYIGHQLRLEPMAGVGTLLGAR